ncbi:Protein of unknown function with HXXEE motif-containing protein [bacterium A37T11]|nr:Protein of unknown function with HXXEE motif-containing protein [bacterium A37T11]
MKKNLIIPCIMAISMTVLFSMLSEGLSLIVTFVPAIPISLWFYYKTCYKHLPASGQIIVLYLLGLGFQLLHFAEEHAFGFDKKFGLLFHGHPYNHNLFVTFNMCAYFLFILGAIGFLNSIRPLMFIGIFFIVYGMLGNAVGHVAFCLAAHGYFPGIYTCFLNVIPGVMLLKRLNGANGR